jgi:hypothetical protein
MFAHVTAMVIEWGWVATIFEELKRVCLSRISSFELND